MSEVGKLTPWQVRHVYFHERDDKGNLKFNRKKQGNPLPSYKEIFFRRWRLMGLREDQIEAKWVKENGG